MLFPPVYVIIGFLVEMPIVAVSYGSCCNFTCHILLDTVYGLFIKYCTTTLVDRCFIEIIGKAIRIDLVRKISWSGIAETVVVVYLHFTRFTLFSGDQDNTECGT